MDIIGHLVRTVTPAVLGDNRTPQNENLLEQFYSLFVAKLADDDTYSRVSTQAVERDDVGFYDRVWTDEAHKTSISQELARENNVEESSVNALVSSAAPLTYLELKDLAGTSTVPQFIRNNWSSFSDRIPLWAKTILPASLFGVGATAVSQPETTHVNTANMSNTKSTEPLQREEKKEGGFLKALLPLIALLILALLAWFLLRSCQDKPEPVAAPVEKVEQSADTEVVAALAPAVLSITSNDANGLSECKVTAGNEALSSSVVDSIKSVFTDDADTCTTDINDGTATDMPGAKHLAAILPIIQASPNAHATIEGDEIRLDAPDAAQLQNLVADLEAAAPGMTIVPQGPIDVEAEVSNSLEAANAAFDNLGDTPTPQAVADALSLQVINFTVDKAIIPDENKEILDRAVEVINNVPNMKLMISGHTDSDGEDAYNKDLSQRRADAVKQYLVDNGVDISKLMTKGMGEEDPIATNDTEAGKFRNRRIAFTVYDESADGEVETIDVVEDTAKVEDSNSEASSN